MATKASSFPIRPTHLLRACAIWMVPVIVGSTVLVLMTLFYIGSVVDPVEHLHGLPISIVNEDRGVTIVAHKLNLGTRLQAGLTGTPAVTRKLSLHRESLADAERRMDRDGGFAAVVIPPNFTASLLFLSGQRLPRSPTPGRPTVRLLSNPRAGPLGVQLAEGVLDRALETGSRQLGRQLMHSTPPAASGSGAVGPLLSDPVFVQTTDYHPPSAHSALGLSAFYVALLTLMCGFLGGAIINATVDSATGYAASEIGPNWRQRPPLPINRWRTLQTKWLIATPLMGLLTALMLVVAVGLLQMDAPNVFLLWIFTWLAAASVAVGTLVLFAALGTQGQLAAVLLFVYLGLASAGGTIPLEALPGPLRLVAQVEPLRQIVDGTRSILYFDASATAGLTRGFVSAAAGLLFWLALGAAVSNFYDRKGYHRMRPDLLAYVQESIGAYQRREATVTDERAEEGEAT